MSGYGRPWTPEEIEALRRDAIRIPTPELAASLGRSVEAIKQMCSQLGIARRPGKAGRPIGWRKVA